MHAADDRPVVFPNKPAGHDEHVTVPWDAAYVPVAHAVQACAPAALYCPTAHGAQGVEPPGEYCPAAHT